MIPGRRWQDLRRDRRTPLERAFSPLVRALAVILAVTVAAAAAVHALHDADTLAEWRAERGGLLARIHDEGGEELAAEASRAIDMRAAELAEARA